MINKDVVFTPFDPTAVSYRCYIIVTGQLYNTKVTLANIYAPNFDDAQFFQRLIKLLPDLNSHLLIMGGDFNLCLDPGMDKSSTRPGFGVTKSASCIQSFLSEFGISDKWRFLHPNSREYSLFLKYTTRTAELTIFSLTIN